MSRLTEKREKPLTTKWKDVPTSYYKIKGDDTGVVISEIGRLNKLGQLEDLEEQIGCHFEVVIKAISNGIYVKDLPSEDTVVEQFGLNLSNIETEWYLFNPRMCVNLKDYKKLFWLREDKSE